MVVARHGFGDQYRATDFLFPGAGTLKLTYTPADGGPPIEKEIIKAPGAGVALAMYNLDDSISGFARACFNYALDRNYPVYLSTKNTILKVYDGRFKNLFQEIFDPEFKASSTRRLDLRTPADRRHGGREPEMERRLSVGLQELRRRRAVRYRGAGLWLTRPDDFRADVARRQDRWKPKPPTAP